MTSNYFFFLLFSISSSELTADLLAVRSELSFFFFLYLQRLISCFVFERSRFFFFFLFLPALLLLPFFFFW